MARRRRWSRRQRSVRSKSRRRAEGLRGEEKQTRATSSAERSAVSRIVVGRSRQFGSSGPVLSPAQGFYRPRQEYQVPRSLYERRQYPSQGSRTPVQFNRQGPSTPVKFPSSQLQVIGSRQLVGSSVPVPTNPKPHAVPFQAVVHEFSVTKQNGRVTAVKLNVYDAAVVANDNTKKASIRPINSTRAPFIGRMVHCAVTSTVSSKWFKTGKSLPERILRKTTKTIRRTLVRSFNKYQDPSRDPTPDRYHGDNYDGKDRTPRMYSRQDSPIGHFERRRAEPVCEMRRSRRNSVQEQLSKTCDERERVARNRTLSGDTSSSPPSPSRCPGCRRSLRCGCLTPNGKVTVYDQHDRREHSLIKSTPVKTEKKQKRKSPCSSSSSSSYTSSSDDEVAIVSTQVVPIAVVNPVGSNGQCSKDVSPQPHQPPVLIVFSPPSSPSGNGRIEASSLACRSHDGLPCPFIRRQEEASGRIKNDQGKESERIRQRTQTKSNGAEEISYPPSEGFDEEGSTGSSTAFLKQQEKKTVTSELPPLRYRDFCEVHKRTCSFEGTSRRCTRNGGTEERNGKKSDHVSKLPKQVDQSKVGETRTSSAESWKSVRSPFNSPTDPEYDRILQEEVTRQLLSIENVPANGRKTDKVIRSSEFKEKNLSHKNDNKESQTEFVPCSDCPNPDWCAGLQTCLKNKSRESHDGANKTVSFDSTSLSKPRSTIRKSPSSEKSKSADSIRSWLRVLKSPSGQKSAKSPGHSPPVHSRGQSPFAKPAVKPKSPSEKKDRKEIRISLVITGVDDSQFIFNGVETQPSDRTETGNSDKKEDSWNWKSRSGQK